MIGEDVVLGIKGEAIAAGLIEGVLRAFKSWVRVWRVDILV